MSIAIYPGAEARALHEEIVVFDGFGMPAEPTEMQTGRRPPLEERSSGPLRPAARSL